MRHLKILMCVCVGVLGVCAYRAEATVSNVSSFKQAYPNAKGVTCKVCHKDAIGRKGNLNPYGESLQKKKLPADAKSLKAEDFRAVESEDSDGDGVANGKEIETGTSPGDPASK